MPKRRQSHRRRNSAASVRQSRSSHRLRFEPLECRRLLAVDFGDAPDPYPTTLADDGARHEAIGPMLGGMRDEEADGQPSTAADGDGADEDGVMFGSIRVGQLDASLTVNVSSAPAGAKLDAWIDFNGDGSWGGPGEQIFDHAPVSNGDNPLEFDVPSWTASGNTYARFRLSTEGDLGVGGLAADGEVEDYLLAISPPVAATGLFVGQNVISTTADFAWDVFAADVDGDGDVDVLSASSVDNKIAWYENDGNGEFTAHTISTDAKGARSVIAADVDGDGDIDVLSASAHDDKIAWYENDGNEGFTTHIISTDADDAGSVNVGDMDGDGDLDVLSTSSRDRKITWYENDGSENFTPHTINTGTIIPRSIFAVDMDGDGDMDMLIAFSNDGTFAWYENDGNQRFTEHTVNTTDGAYKVFPADVDGDGDIDVFSVSGTGRTIDWHENDGNGAFTAHTISTNADRPFTVFAADLDGDGDIDVLSASTWDDKIAWYENDGSGGFTDHVISTTANGPSSVVAADVDGDGDLDVLSAFYEDDKIAWYENLAPTGFDFGDAPAPYPTLDSAAGASHLFRGPRLGAMRDIESDGQPSNNADGDGDDEDGVTLAAVHAGQLNARVTVNVQNAPQGAKLNAWIDFNGDGAWGGPREQIFENVSVTNGDNILLFDAPTWASVGNTYARFRLNTEGNLSPGGEAADGEVEDYPLTIDPFAPAPGVFVGQNTISTDAEGARSVHAADVDGDGDVDVISASWDDDKIAWYENDGSGGFTAHVISTDADGARSVYAADVDSDGDMDVLSASRRDNKIAWYENDGSEGFTLHVIGTDTRQAVSVYAADIDGDGDMDLLSASGDDSNDKIVWYENDGSENFTPHILADRGSGLEAPNSVSAADLDGDGDLGVLAGTTEERKILWFENDGSEGFTAHTISAFGLDIVSVFAADVDGDGDIDVLSASFSDDRIAWYENDGGGGFTAHTISTNADSARSVYAADVDGDGDIDVLSASFRDNTIAWYENDGTPGGIGDWRAHTISDTADGAYSVFAADIDGDGDIDVLSASRDDNKIAWYENVSPIVSEPSADLTGDGFVDFEDLTVLLAAWNQNVSAAEGNLVDAAGTPVNFGDLTVLLAAWTGPGPVGAPIGRRLAVAVGGDFVGDVLAPSFRFSPSETHPTKLVAVGDASYRARRAARRSRSASGIYGRLQAVAVDRVMAEEVMADRRAIVGRRSHRRAR